MRDKKIIEIIVCDMCGKEDKDCKSLNIPVLFTTDQTEGRAVTPYVTQQPIDMCSGCIEKALTVTGYGAQGYNTYKWLEKVGESSE